MKKYLYYLFLMMVLVVPFNVYAATEEEANAIFDKISNKKNEAGIYVIDIPSLEPAELIPEGQCVYTKERLLEECPDCYPDYTDEDFNEMIALNEESCLTNFTHIVIKMHLKNIGITNTQQFSFSTYGNTLTLAVEADEATDSPTFHERNYLINYTGSSKKDYKDEARKVADKLKNGYTLYGLDVMNAVYHYGGTEANIYNNDLILYKYPEVKDLMQQNKSFDFTVALGGAGCDPTGCGNDGYIGISKDSILLAIKNVGFGLNHTIFVDKTEEGTAFEKAEKLIKDYFDETVTVEVIDDAFDAIENDSYVNNAINKLLGKESGTYVGYYTTVKIDDVQQSIFIVEIEKEALEKKDENVVETTNYEEGIIIESNSYEVPLDIIITAEDAANEENVKKAAKENKLKFKHIFNIKITSPHNNKDITNIKKGVTVYIPVTGYKEKDKVLVYYIKDNGEIGETIEGTIVKKNNKLYVKFTTTHFSTYGIGEKITEEGSTKVPDTGDNLDLYIALGTAAALGLILIKKKSMI